MVDKRFIIIKLEQGSPEWIEYRKDRIGASDVAAIMGKDNWVSPLMKWEEKVLGKQRPKNQAMQRGHDEEPRALAWVNADRGSNYVPVVMQSSIYPWLMVSLDGWDTSSDPTLLEIKTPSKQVFLNCAQGIISPGYMIQCQTQMWVSGAEKVLFVTWNEVFGHKLVIPRDEKMIHEIEVATINFRRRCIELNPPEPIDMDEYVIMDSRACSGAERLKELDKTISQLESERESIRNDLQKACGDHSVSVVNGYRISQYERRGSIDYSAIEELKDVNLEKYRKPPTTSWRFTCKP